MTAENKKEDTTNKKDKPETQIINLIIIIFAIIMKYSTILHGLMYIIIGLLFTNIMTQSTNVISNQVDQGNGFRDRIEGSIVRAPCIGGNRNGLRCRGNFIIKKGL